MSSISQAQPQGRSANRRQLMIAAVLGLIAAVLVIVFLNNSSKDKTTPAIPVKSVVVAAQAIDAGTKITDQMLTTRAVPETAVASDAFTDKTAVVGQVARYPIEKGETLSAARLVSAPKVQALSFQIPPGMRGMTIPVSITNTPAALIAPGDFVDVLVTVDAVTLTGRVQPTVTVNAAQKDVKGVATIVQNVQVLSVDRDYVDTGVVYDPSVRGNPPGQKDSVSFVTLAVTPDQAQLLWLAQDQGKLTLVLRPFGEDNIVPLVPKVEPLALP